jgi:hypothetical protein
VNKGKEYRGPGITPPGYDGRSSVILCDVADPAHPSRPSAR